MHSAMLLLELKVLKGTVKTKLLCSKSSFEETHKYTHKYNGSIIK